MAATVSGRRQRLAAVSAPEPELEPALQPETGPAKPAPDGVDGAAEFRQKAQDYALEALETLHTLVQSAASEAVRVSAANALIDRAHGRPAQAVRVGSGEAAAEDGHSVVLKFEWLDPAKS